MFHMGASGNAAIKYGLENPASAVAAKPPARNSILIGLNVEKGYNYYGDDAKGTLQGGRFIFNTPVCRYKDIYASPP